MLKIKRGSIKNRKVVISAIVLGAAALLLNFMTPYAADDFSYMYSFKDGSRITSFFQIFSSIYAHYMTINGRTVPHFLVQLFLMGPKWIFNIFNSLVYIALVLLVYRLTDNARGFRMLLCFIIPVFFWLFIPSYGQIFLWLDGSINYVWSYLAAMIYLIPYLNLYTEGKKIETRPRRIFFLIYSFLWGAYSESISFAVIFVSFIMCVVVMKKRKSIRENIFYIYPVIAGAIGYLTILASPGGAVNHISIGGIGQIAKNLINIYENFFISQKTLFILWAVLMVVAVYKKADKKRIEISLFFMLMNICSVTILCVGNYLEMRSFAAGSFLLIVSVVNLMQAVCSDQNAECLVYCICVYFMVGNLLSFYNGIYDIYDTNRRNSAREAYIEEQVELGAQVITVSQIEAATPYCAKYGLADIRKEDEDTRWPNPVIAEYYGLEMIYGVSQ